MLDPPPRTIVASQARGTKRHELYPDPERQQFRVRSRNGLEKNLEEIHSKLELEEFYADRVRCYAAIAQAAAGNADISCARALPADLGDWRRTMEFVLGPYRFGAELTELSAKEYALSIDRSPGRLCRQGVGALIGKLALGMPIKFFSPVTLVDWAERSVALTTGEGVVTARAVIVTASTAVLASGKLRFRPNLPGAYASACEKLKLGSYDHVALAFNANALGLDANEVVFERAYTTKTAALLANIHGTRLSVLTLAGRSGVELADKGEDAMTDFALDWITGVFGSRAKKAVLRACARHVLDQRPLDSRRIFLGTAGRSRSAQGLIRAVRRCRLVCRRSCPPNLVGHGWRSVAEWRARGRCRHSAARPQAATFRWRLTRVAVKTTTSRAICVSIRPCFTALRKSVRQIFRPLKIFARPHAQDFKSASELSMLMSAIPPKADILRRNRHVRLVPKADIMRCSNRSHLLRSS